MLLGLPLPLDHVVHKYSPFSVDPSIEFINDTPDITGQILTSELLEEGCIAGLVCQVEDGVPFSCELATSINLTCTHTSTHTHSACVLQQYIQCITLTSFSWNLQQTELEFTNGKPFYWQVLIRPSLSSTILVVLIHCPSLQMDSVKITILSLVTFDLVSWWQFLGDHSLTNCCGFSHNRQCKVPRTSNQWRRWAGNCGWE